MVAYKLFKHPVGCCTCARTMYYKCDTWDITWGDIRAFLGIYARGKTGNFSRGKERSQKFDVTAQNISGKCVARSILGNVRRKRGKYCNIGTPNAGNPGKPREKSRFAARDFPVRVLRESVDFLLSAHSC